MEKRICKEQASYRIIDSGTVCVIYSSFETSNTWIGTIASNHPGEFKLVLPCNNTDETRKPLEATDKQKMVNWLIETNELQLSLRTSD